MLQVKYHLITLGCQMNKSDSERLASLLDSLGLQEVDRPEEANLVILNSCSVRQAAEDRVFGRVRELAELKRTNPRLIVGVTGCMAGRDTDGRIRAKLPDVDLFFPTADMVHLPQWLVERRLIDVDDTKRPQEYLKIAPRYSSPYQAFVSIQTGCNNFCTYCVVPYARGLEKNRPAADILAEVRALAASGVSEVTLLGQTVNSYRAPDPEGFSKDNPYTDHFAALLWEVNQFEGLGRVHFTAPHPNSMTDQVIDALALPKQANYLHLPVQSGSDEMLRKMNRKYSRADFLNVIRRIHERKPEICLGTDIIVGFCGETEEMFEETVSLYREVDFDIAYLAIYSPRTGTPAWRAFKDDVTRDDKKRRWRRLHDLMEETVRRRNQKYAGQTVSVLVENCNSQGICSGNSWDMKIVRFPGSVNFIGRTIMVRIDTAREWVLDGQMI
ncbi:tRNA (N6-isopentenyl adenosine(37)-C2)-methylthiotransferase MiaB [Candidatus Uhrbacteria bacterium RIFOXYC2_FULL_47_19]|uniref:tRNA-2-methylthio-N(6)-dimethylallyladenosine synthase n=1 Tax=Candidatus Uhrbacteria bacterium RIFOXYC2_FULL_47_19 TaxID=1802424 RepID=A0A1F7WEL5_9BACT|nr:MAG: tRNA (N6-isopentenyl adenosine(37)-C2)-methylthiotransferase MiaB [Candidatus Uhrbacteria bacterium RIFOXYC2_FULL_47_19]